MQSNFHARHKAQIRLNAYYTDADFKRISDKIANGQGTKLKTFADVKSLYKVAYNGNIINVVISQKSGKVCTFITDEQVETYGNNRFECDSRLCKYCKVKCAKNKDFCKDFNPSALLSKLEMLDVIYSLQTRLNKYQEKE